MLHTCMLLWSSYIDMGPQKLLRYFYVQFLLANVVYLAKGFQSDKLGYTNLILIHSCQQTLSKVFGKLVNIRLILQFEISKSFFQRLKFCIIK